MRILAVMAACALVFAAVGCARKQHPAGPTTGDGIPVEMNSSDNAAGY